MRPLSLLVVTAITLVGCKKAQPPAAQTPVTPAASTAAAPANNIPGKLLERIDASPYSYLKLQTSQGEVWAAVPETKLEKGADVTVYSAMQMNAFESKTLKRTFETIFFGTLTPAAGANAGTPANSPAGAAMQHATAAKGPADVADVKVDKATGADARTIAEIYAQKAGLKEKTVTVRGKVVKFNPEVMSKNWFHLRDGSGTPGAGNNDLTVTTKDTVKVGDIVQVKGIVKIDKDFGSGYTYAVIVEEGKIIK